MFTNRKTTIAWAIGVLVVIEACFCMWEFVIRPRTDLCDNHYGITVHCKSEGLLCESEQELDKLPDRLLAAFEQEGWSLWIGDDYLRGEQTLIDSHISGATHPTRKEVLVSGAGEILHEFGHFLYLRLGEPEDFVNVYAQEAGNSPLRLYYQQDAHEYFAECFAYYISGIDIFGDTPATLRYFDQLRSENWRLA